MMIIQGTKRALGPNLTASFLASGGTAPYTYSVQDGGAGGSIDSVSGLYTAPGSVSNDPSGFYDIIQATDSSTPAQTVLVKILVGNPWMLFREILQSVLNLDDQLIWFQNQKTFEPTDAQKGMWVVLMFPNIKTFASGLHPAGAITQTGPGWDQTEKWANFSGPVDIHLISRDLSALNRIGEVVMALDGPYSQAQQSANSFYIARIPHNIVDISGVDGDAIPFHFVVSVEVQYKTSKVFGSDYYGSVPIPQIVVNK